MVLTPTEEYIGDTVDLVTPIKEYIETSNKPQHEGEANRIRHLTPCYTIIDSILYKRVCQHPFLDDTLPLNDDHAKGVA